MVLLWSCTLATLPQAESLGEPQLTQGAVLVLMRSLPVPGDVWSVYFQDGELLRFGAIDDSRVYCELYLNGSRGHDWLVQPDRFEITRIHSMRRDTSSLPSPPALAEYRLASFRQQASYRTILSLHSSRQPDVRELRCPVLYDAGWNVYPEVDSFHRVLGDYFDLLPSAEAEAGDERRRPR